ncbi:MAG: septum formation protein Maf [Candidatus Thermoplasmatota archaeon]|nr:septum formation protein Maf [Candidatus Thermoplasmatota archaeon]
MGLILASGSPRRIRLMKEAGLEFLVRIPDIDESLEGQPEDLVVRNAEAKASSAVQGDDEVIIGADTVVVCNGEVLGKPDNVDDARRMLELELRYPQTVITGVCVLDVCTGKEFTGYEISKVLMENDPGTIAAYLESGQWAGKAGAYGIQDLGSLKARVVMGAEDNVMGLPMTLVGRLLALVGFRYPERTPAVE